MTDHDRLIAEITRLTNELRAVKSNAEAEIEVLRDRLEEARNERDAALREPRSFTLKVLRLEVRDAWRQLRSDHTHDPEDEGTLAEEIATLQRVWHAAEDDLSRTRAELNASRRLGAPVPDSATPEKKP